MSRVLAAIALCILGFILDILHSILASINFFAITYSAVHGTSFVRSVKESFEAVSSSPVYVLGSLHAPEMITGVFSFLFLLCAGIGTFFFYGFADVVQISKNGLKLSDSLVSQGVLVTTLTILAVNTILLFFMLESISSAVLALVYAHIRSRSLVEDYNPRLSDAFNRKTTELKASEKQ